jgi:hypothetical protein
MKKSIFLTIAFCFLAFSLAFTGCQPDEDDSPTTKDITLSIKNDLGNNGVIDRIGISSVDASGKEIYIMGSPGGTAFLSPYRIDNGETDTRSIRVGKTDYDKWILKVSVHVTNVNTSYYSHYEYDGDKIPPPNVLSLVLTGSTSGDTVWTSQK